ncbi:MAG: ABC transporter permease [Eubacteriales bacterium]|nr:ABC transporter permease [Eubacteriales bacterium]
MRKVSNKKVIRNTAMKMIVANKKKNLAVIIAVILTTILFTIVFSVAMSLNTTFQNETMHQVGGQSMAGLKYASYEDYEMAVNDPKTKDVSYRVLVGMLKDASRKANTEVYYAQDENAVSSFSYPTVGRMPEEEKDVVLSDIVLKALDVEPELGKTLHLTIEIGEKEIEDDFQLCGWYESNKLAPAQLMYVSKQYQEKVAPTPEVSYKEQNPENVYGYLSVDFNFESAVQIENQMIAFLERNGKDIKDEDVYGINWAYTTANLGLEDMVMVIPILLLIMLAGYLIIYNIYYIRVNADIHQYGLLKTIGTTGKQLKKIVWMQASILSTIGIAFGLIIGTVLASIVLPMIIGMTSVDTSFAKISIHPAIYVFATFFSLVTVWIGCRKPGKIVASISPVEAVSYMPVDHVKRKKKKTKKVSVFGLARANMGRERRKYVLVVVSLSLSLVLVNATFCIGKSVCADRYVSANVIGDFIIADYATMTHRGDEESAFVSKQEMEELQGIPGVEHVSGIYCNEHAAINLDGDAEDYFKRIIRESGEDEYDYNCENVINNSRIPCDYFGIDEQAAEYVEYYEGEWNSELWETGEYAIVSTNQMISDESADCYHVGDEVTVLVGPEQTRTYKVMAVGAMPYALSTQAYSMVGSEVIVPQKEYVKDCGDEGALKCVMLCDQDKLLQLEEQVKEFVEESSHLSYSSKGVYLEDVKETIRSMQLISGGLALILALIGFMNFANSTITGIWKRARELAMMQAVGLTKKQMLGMLICEGVLQGIATFIVSMLFYVICVGPVISVIMAETMIFQYQFVIAPLIVMLPVVLLIAAVIPYASYQKMQQQSVVERMRVE